jgi:hypothetical protein
LGQLPGDFKILEDTIEVTIDRLTVNERTDEKGNFSVFGEGQMRAFGFRETDIASIFNSIVSKEYPNYWFREIKLEYKNAKADFTKNELRFTVGIQSVIEPSFDAESFRSQVAGKRMKEIKSAIADLTDLAAAKASFWPRWLFRAPRNAAKVTVKVQ